MDCSTIIVSYNTFDLTREAVASVLASDPDLQHEVIVVDNASPDQSGERLAEVFAGDGRVHIERRSTNAGFSAANNIGAGIAGGRVLFFLNPDTVVYAGAIGSVVRFLDAHPEAGACGPHIVNPDGTDQPSIHHFASVRDLLAHYLALGRLLRPIASTPARTCPVDVVKGCALALRREVFDHVGGWDESYFMYAEEKELCWALTSAGYTNYFLREATVLHYGGQSTRERSAHFHRMERQSAVSFLRRHHSRSLVALDRALGIVGYGGRAVVWSVASRLRPDRTDLARSRDAATALWRWFLFEHR